MPASTQIHIRLPVEMIKELRHTLIDLNLDRSKFVRQAIEHELKRIKKAPK